MASEAEIAGKVFFRLLVPVHKLGSIVWVLFPICLYLFSPVNFFAVTINRPSECAYCWTEYW